MFSRTPESADGNGSGGSTGRFGSGSRHVAEAERRLLRHLGPHVLDHVAARAGVQRDAPVEVDDAAVADRDVVEAGVADARAEALAVDRVAVEVDRDPVGADDQAVEQAVDEVVADDRAARQHLAAVHERPRPAAALTVQS